MVGGGSSLDSRLLGCGEGVSLFLSLLRGFIFCLGEVPYLVLCVFRTVKYCLIFWIGFHRGVGFWQWVMFSYLIGIICLRAGWLLR